MLSKDSWMKLVTQSKLLRIWCETADEAIKLEHLILSTSKTTTIPRNRIRLDPTKIVGGYSSLTSIVRLKTCSERKQVVQLSMKPVTQSRPHGYGVKPVDEAIKLEHPTTIHFEDNDYTVKQDVDRRRSPKVLKTIVPTSTKSRKPAVKGNVVQNSWMRRQRNQGFTDTGVKTVVDEAIKLEHPNHYSL